MLNQATMDMLTSMKMTAMAAEFANQLKDPTFNELGFKERLGLLVSAEWNRRQSNKLNRFIRNARFAVPSATVEGIEYHEDRKLDKAQMLRFATCQYIDEGHHIILKGASGNSKTYIACALGKGEQTWQAMRNEPLYGSREKNHRNRTGENVSCGLRPIAVSVQSRRSRRTALKIRWIITPG